MKTPTHLSFAALDTLRRGRSPSAEECRHLAGCPLCAGYLEPPLVVARPAWLDELATPAPAVTEAPAEAGAPPARARRWLLPALAAAPGLAAGGWYLVRRMARRGRQPAASGGRR